MKEHELRTWPESFQAIVSGKKRYEVRPDDRDFEVGDLLVLREWDPTTKTYSGNAVRAEVTYLTRGQFGVPSGLVVMSISAPRSLTE